MFLRAVLWAAFGLTLCARGDVSIIVTDERTKEIPSTMYGFMWEDINHSGDGGLYAELLQNRAFQKTTELGPWSALTNGTSLSVTTTDGVSAALPNSLLVTIAVDSPESVTFANSGYWGIKVSPSTTYTGSFYAKSSSYTGAITSSLQSASESTPPVVYTSAEVVPAGEVVGTWTKYNFNLTTGNEGAPDIDNVFAITLAGGAEASIQFGLFTLFPPTYKDRPNGLRKDLAETLAATAPKVWRFPGGNNLEGESTDTRWKWNETIGPLENRPGRMGDWTYINTDGLGLMEYLQWAEDLGATVILGVWAGYSLDTYSVPAAQLQAYIQEVLDELHFLLDPPTTPLGTLRAQYGHEEPYDIPYVEIGNEDNLSGAVASYQAYRWKMYHDAIAAEFPQLNIMATTRASQPVSPVPDFIDYHVYTHPRGMVTLATQFDSIVRSTKYFVGEYAVVSLSTSDIWNNMMPWPIVRGAAAEASYMIGFERNADVVFASAYAPTLQHIRGTQWTPNLIVFDAGTVVRSVSYFVQEMFGTHVGTHVLASGTGLADPVFWTASVQEQKAEVYLKLSNNAATPQNVTIDLSALELDVATGAEWISIGNDNFNASNTFDSGEVYTPVTTTVALDAGSILNLALGPWSASVITLKTA